MYISFASTYWKHTFHVLQWSYRWFVHVMWFVSLWCSADGWCHGWWCKRSLFRAFISEQPAVTQGGFHFSLRTGQDRRGGHISYSVAWAAQDRSLYLVANWSRGGRMWRRRVACAEGVERLVVYVFCPIRGRSVYSLPPNPAIDHGIMVWSNGMVHNP